MILDPISGAAKEGVSGFFKGVGTGLTGVVLKPVTGALSGTYVGEAPRARVRAPHIPAPHPLTQFLAPLPPPPPSPLPPQW